MRARFSTTRRRPVPAEQGALWEIAALGGPPRRVAPALGGGDVSHDGRRIALFQSSANHIELVTMARDGSQRSCVARLSPESLYRSPRWSPDDRWLAFQRDDLSFTNCLEIVPVAGGEPREVARSEWLKGFSWLPDGSGLVYSSSRGSTLLYPPIFNLRTVGRHGRDDRQLTYGDLVVRRAGRSSIGPAAGVPQSESVRHLEGFGRRVAV